MSDTSDHDTTDDSGVIPCPWCGAGHGDLWDHDWSGGRECIEVECHDCEEPFTLIRRVSVDYTAKRVTP